MSEGALPPLAPEASLPESLRHQLERDFALEREIGRGGMATVWLARRRLDGASVAIKILQPSLAQALGVERFLREIRIAGQTRSPHLVPLESSGEADGLPFYVMPYIEGESLRERLRREHQLPVEEAVRIGRAIALGLAALHQDGIVHRDIKPENVLLRKDGEVLVADYGIARALTISATEKITSTGIVVGTPAYMSPEQAGGDAVDARSDQYAWGCIQYEMLAGVPPFHGASSQAVMARHMHEAPPSLRVVRPNLPEALESVVIRAMGKSPADRFANVEALLQTLDRVDLTDLRPLAALQRARRRRLRAAGAVAAVGIALAAYAYFHPATPLDPGRVVVFPFTDAEPGHEREAEQATILVGTALERMEPTRWLDGWSLLSPSERSSLSRIAPARSARLARAQRARYYLDGSIVRQPDSLRILVQLHDLEQRSDTSVHAAGPPGASVAELGIAAVVGLLPRLTGLERVIDVSSLRGRNPVAVSNWVRGEREYRQSRMRPALEYLQRAVTEDELLAPAALRGATAAIWINRPDTARALVSIALRSPQALAPRQAAFGAALQHFLLGRADSAVIALRRVLALDPEWADAWMLLGEVYLHLLPSINRDPQALGAVPPPSTWPLESWAEEAFKRALALDPGFTPPLSHLAEIAARRGDRGQFGRYADLLRRANADSLPLATIALMRACLDRAPRELDWNREAHRSMRIVFRVGVMLQGASDPAARRCGRGAFTGLLGADSARNQEDWSSLVSLHAMLAAEGAGAAALGLADSAIRGGMNAPLGLYVLDAAAGLDPGQRADAFVAQLQAAIATRPAPSLWLLTLWSAQRADTAWLFRARAELKRRMAAPTGGRLDSLMARVADAYVALAEHDSVIALKLFGALAPTGTIDELEGTVWEPLAPERLTYARLLLAQGDAAAAHRVASVFDQPGILIYPLFLRESLLLRERAARALGDARLAGLAQSRLQELSATPH